MRRRARRAGRRRRRVAGALVPVEPRRRRRAGRLRALRRPRPPRQRGAHRGRRDRPPHRAGLPERRGDADPRRRAARAPDPRVRRPRDRARPRARHGGVVRGHELRAGGGPRPAALRIQADERRRRRDHGRRARLVRLGRRGRPGGSHTRRHGRGADRLPDLARDGGRDRPRRIGRLHARRRLRPPADRPDDERVARAGRRRHARGPDRRHRRRPVDGDEPLLVDRPAPLGLPVRDRGRLGDQGRRARPAPAQRRATAA